MAQKIVGQVIEEVQENFYLLATADKCVIMKTEDKLKIGVSYTFMKPEERGVGIFFANTKQKIMKAKPCMRKEVKPKEKALLMMNLQKILEKEPCPKNTQTEIVPFEELFGGEAGNAGKSVTKMTVMVKRLSNNIKGQYGFFKVMDVKDTKNKALAVYIYHDKLKDVKQGDIVTMTNMKMSKMKRDDEEFRRVQTTPMTNVTIITDEVQDLFKDVTIGDIRAKGTVVGIVNVRQYDSCRGCHKKVQPIEDENEKKEKIKIKCPFCDFCEILDANYVTDIMVETEKNTTIVVTVFKKAMEVKEINDSEAENNEMLEDILTEKLTDKNIVFEGDKKSKSSDEEDNRFTAIYFKLSN